MSIKYFINYIPHYDTNYYTFKQSNNYMIHPSAVASDIGFKNIFIVKSGKEFLVKDNNFLEGSEVFEYDNFFNFLKIIFKYNKKDNIFYVNSVTILSFVIGFLVKKSIFISHGQNDKRGFLRQTLYNILVSRFSRVRVNSLGDFYFLKKFSLLKNKIRYIPLVVNSLDFFKTNLNDYSRKDLVVLGSLRPCKGTRSILQSFAKVLEAMPDTKLHIIGYIHDEDYSIYVKKLGLENSIIEHGFMKAGKDMNDLLNSCAVYINSSLTEGQCLAAYEAALAGCALCVSNISAFKYNLKEHALLHEPNDYNQLAKNIICLLSDVKLRTSQNSEIINFIKTDYSVRSISDKLRDLYNIKN